MFSIKQDSAILQTGEVSVFDVRFTARKSQNEYYSSVVLQGLISLNKAAIEEELSAEILAIGVDMCKFTRCDNGCQTVTDVKFVS